MLNILLTYDYEIFFGKNLASEDEILFNPTSEILKLMQKYDLYGTFFADVCSIVAYNRANPSSDYPKKFAEQIQKCQGLGHDVQLHIHPHWLTAKYNGQWISDHSTYRIHHYIDHPEVQPSAEDIIAAAVNYLNETLKPIKSDYKCYAYRAGGYCLEPRERLLQILSEHGICIDSSVAIGKKLHTDTHSFDYSQTYRVLNWDIGSGVYEIPIGSVRNNLLKRLIPFSGFRTLSKFPAKGEGINGANFRSTSRIEQLLNYNKNYKEFGLEFMDYRQLMYGLKEYCRKYQTSISDSYVAVICHPKSMDAVSLKNMEKFITLILDNESIRFTTLSEAAMAILPYGQKENQNK